MILIIFLYALFASSFSMGKLLLCYTTPLFLVASRMFIAGSLLLIYQYFWAHHSFKFKKKHIWMYAQIVFFGVYFNYILRFWALNYLASSKACFLYNLSPFFAAFYSYLFFNETITKKQWLGLGVGFSGFIPILLSTSSVEQFMGEFSFLSWPEVACIASVASHSYSWIVMRKLIRYKNYSPSMVNGISMFTGGCLALITSIFYDGSFIPVTNGAKFSLILAAVILISNIICHNLYGHLLKQYTATFLSFAGFLSPVFAAFYGWLFLSEVPTWHFYISSIVVFIGLYLFYQDEFRHNIPQEEPNP